MALDSGGPSKLRRRAGSARVAMGVLLWLTYLLSTTPVSAQGSEAGDVVFSSLALSDQGFASGEISWYSEQGERRGHFVAGVNYIFALLFGVEGRLYGARPENDSGVVHFGTNFSPAGTFGPPIPAASAMARDAEGNVFVGGLQLYKLDPNGNVLAVLNAPGGMLDLAADQCTMYIAQQHTKTIRRYDVCQDAPLESLTTSLPGSSAYDLRILPDGTILVANWESIVRLTATGAVLLTYSVPDVSGYRALAVAPDGQSFWVGTASKGVYRIRLDGAVIGGPLPAAAWVTSIAVVGEPRVALVMGANIPTLSGAVLILLALSFAAIALTRC